MGSGIMNAGGSRATFVNAPPPFHVPSPRIPISGDRDALGRLLISPLKASGEVDCIVARSARPPHTLHPGVIIDNTEPLEQAYDPRLDIMGPRGRSMR